MQLCTGFELKRSTFMSRMLLVQPALKITESRNMPQVLNKRNNVVDHYECTIHKLLKGIWVEHGAFSLVLRCSSSLQKTSLYCYAIPFYNARSDYLPILTEPYTCLTEFCNSSQLTSLNIEATSHRFWQKPMIRHLSSFQIFAITTTFLKQTQTEANSLLYLISTLPRKNLMFRTKTQHYSKEKWAPIFSSISL